MIPSNNYIPKLYEIFPFDVYMEERQMNFELDGGIVSYKRRNPEVTAIYFPATFAL